MWLGIMSRYLRAVVAGFFIFLACHSAWAQLPQPIYSDTYVLVGGSGGFIVVNSGGINVAGDVACSGNAVVHIQISSTPNTGGTEIGSYHPANSTGYVWYPSQVGDFYLSTYLTLNGDTPCKGNASGPVTQFWRVTNP